MIVLCSTGKSIRNRNNNYHETKISYQHGLLQANNKASKSQNSVKLKRFIKSVDKFLDVKHWENILIAQLKFIDKSNAQKLTKGLLFQ